MAFPLSSLSDYKSSAIGAILPAPMFFFPFLLFQFKLSLFLRFPLLPAHNLAFSFQLLLL
jgi:hypothetical protein